MMTIAVSAASTRVPSAAQGVKPNPSIVVLANKPHLLKHDPSLISRRLALIAEE